jgi:uncharacterized protein with NRDE domain
VCLVLVAWQQDQEWPLIVAGNRDEFHSRPTEGLHWWPDKPQLLAGRDLQAGGTWLAVGRNGRFAAVTNYRDAVPPQAGLRSRGDLVTDFVCSSISPLDYVEQLDGDAYAGYNLFVCDGRRLAFASNRNGTPRELDAGLYGLANAELDAPWHKTQITKERFRDRLESGKIKPNALLKLLNDRERAPVEEVLTNGLDFELAHAVTAPFVVQPDYGTRSTTVVLMDRNGQVDVTERRFISDGSRRGETHKTFQSE